MSAAPSFGTEPVAVNAGLGKSVAVKGHLMSGEDLTIDGEVDGTIEVLEHRLTIAATGTVRADVNARDIEIWGCIEGKLEAANLVCIRKGARFVGEIHSAGIVVEEGGYIKGSIDLSRHPANSQRTPDESSIDSSRHTSKAASMQHLSEAVLRS